MLKEETKSSKAARSHPDWDPDWIEMRFIAKLQCSNPQCAENVFSCGEVTTHWEIFYDPEGAVQEDLEDSYIPKFFVPCPMVFAIPKQCPAEVRNNLQEAFALIWPDEGSAGNRLRVAVESLLNERNIEKKAKIKNGSNKGKYRQLSLHERIERFEKKNPEAATQLMAIKWIGNTGSHDTVNALGRDDLLDAFEHFEYALDLIYVKKHASLEKRAKKIIKKKGPVKEAT